MTDKEAVEKKGTGEPATRQVPETVYVPDADISENADLVRLVLEMPGVDRDSVDVTLEGSTLTVEGTGCVDSPDGYELVGREFGIGKYRREFTVSDAVDTDSVKARVNHGLLELTLPKREEVKTKKITVES
jgi:HSP20 family molecular chaperone IbpA